MPNALETLVSGMTITELAARSGRSVASIVDYALGTTASRGVTTRVARNEAPTKRRAKRGPRASVTRNGRATFDDRVLAAIEAVGGEARSVDIEGAVGGTPVERRAALRRLVEQKKLKKAGVSRATRYSLR